MNMRELINDPFYKLIEKYDRCIIDYCLIEDDTAYQGYRSHKDVILFAMLKVTERYGDAQSIEETGACGEVSEEQLSWKTDIEKAHGHQIDPAELLHVPKILRTDHVGRKIYDCDIPNPLKGEQIPYWYAFWEPRILRDTDRMIFARSIPSCFRREQMNLKYMSGQQTGRIILMTVMNGGALHVGVYTTSA